MMWEDAIRWALRLGAFVAGYFIWRHHWRKPEPSARDLMHGDDDTQER